MSCRTLIAVVAAVSAATSVFAGDTPGSTGPPATIITLSGAKYESAVVTSVAPDAITITHSTGVARIPFVDLPADLQKQYGYDPAKAAAYQAQLAETATERRQMPKRRNATDGPETSTTDLGAKYRDGLNAILSDTPIGEIKITDATRLAKFVSDSETLSSTMTRHAGAIFTKWVEVGSTVSQGGLSEHGAVNIFLKQFTQEDALENVRVLTDARTVKDSLVASEIQGTERLRCALDAVFRNYASICELDRTPSSDPADFLHELRTKMEFLKVSYVAYLNELKAITERVKAKTKELDAQPQSHSL